MSPTPASATPVLFRREKDGEIVAVFPTILDSPGMMTCYAHLGQHSSCCLDWLRSTKPATETEYRDLLRELEAQGYDDLKVYRRMAEWMHRERHTAERR